QRLDIAGGILRIDADGLERFGSFRVLAGGAFRQLHQAGLHILQRQAGFLRLGPQRAQLLGADTKRLAHVAELVVRLDGLLDEIDDAGDGEADAERAGNIQHGALDAVQAGIQRADLAERIAQIRAHGEQDVEIARGAGHVLLSVAQLVDESCEVLAVRPHGRGFGEVGQCAVSFAHFLLVETDQLTLGVAEELLLVAVAGAGECCEDAEPADAFLAMSRTRTRTRCLTRRTKKPALAAHHACCKASPSAPRNCATHCMGLSQASAMSMATASACWASTASCTSGVASPPVSAICASAATTGSAMACTFRPSRKRYSRTVISS